MIKKISFRKKKGWQKFLWAAAEVRGRAPHLSRSFTEWFQEKRTLELRLTEVIKLASWRTGTKGRACVKAKRQKQPGTWKEQQQQESPLGWQVGEEGRRRAWRGRWSYDLMEHCAITERVPAGWEFKMAEKKGRDINEEATAAFQRRNEVAWTEVSKIKRRSI